MTLSAVGGAKAGTRAVFFYGNFRSGEVKPIQDEGTAALVGPWVEVHSAVDSPALQVPSFLVSEES
jgi:hypothetical protein